MAPSIPDRWKDYKPIGEKIEGTRFIAFKVPLKEHISKNVNSDIRLDGNILLKMVPNLGLIIDLTNTNRYYDPKFFEKEGVEHKKLMTPGHETPPKYIVKRFNKMVKDFLENNTNNDKLIGIHCTHGVNRTGYLICNYMITQMTMEPNEALDRFSNARGHKIERDNYIDALHKLLQNPDEKVQNEHNNKSHRVQHRKYSRSPKNYRNRYENNRRQSRSRSHSPSTFYADHNQRNNHYSYRNRIAAEPNRRQSRSRSRSPLPFYANNDLRNNYYNYPRSANEIPYCPMPQPQLAPYCPIPPPQLVQSVDGQLLITNPVNYQPPYQPPRLRLDYYNTRPSNGREHNRNLQRNTSKRNTHNVFF
ncbi:RNA/RNP complex-1-interacting phosphatase [Lucilia sericata]|uniref:RNA/RNP complex-1-interacting phosphatase n=1 Tax=Lucilia sericata TaxID=13632 RepID=UPI0018A86AA7|nr:RNA/RNP complex-1-interacting phosphatase [Lucilia sericata]